MADANFVQYYQRELAYYRALAQQFADEFPEVGYLTSERGGDPAAERLFEGAALLTARLRQRIEDDLPEISHPLFGRLWPQFLRPIPAVTLLCFRALPNAVQRSQKIPRGTLVWSRAGEKEPAFPFQTTADFELPPLTLEAVELSRRRAGELDLRLRLDLGSGSFDQAQLRSLRVQFLGEERTRYSLFGWVCQSKGVSLTDESGATVLSLPPSQIRPVGLSSGEALCPGAPTPLPDLDLLRDYFVFPEKYQGVEVLGLDRPLAGQLGSRFDCVFHLGPLPDPAFTVGLKEVALGCVPAVNLSESTKLDVGVPAGATRFHLEVGEGQQVFAVERVRAYHYGRREWMDIPPLTQLGSGPGEQGLRFVLLHLQEGVAGLQSYLALTDEEGRPVSPKTDALQVWLTCTDGVLPLRLGPQSIDGASASSPGFATFTNLSPVRPGHELRLYQDRLWHLLAQLTMHPNDLCSLNGLRLILRELQGERDQPGAHELREVSCGLSTTLFRRTVVPLRKVELVFADSSFVAPGQMLLFGGLVARLFAPPPESIGFCEVTVRGEPSGVAFRFSLPPRD